ncbi:DUF5654 family protein [Patescibacteria group bacterium]|nr:DUF5654 family protein [Patescibacteria group bacterium]
MLNLLYKLLGGAQSLKHQFVKELLKLVVSGFGLVAALAWNEVIKELVSEYIKPAVGGASEIISLLIYALVVTFLAVFITFNLTRISGRK